MIYSFGQSEYTDDLHHTAVVVFDSRSLTVSVSLFRSRIHVAFLLLLANTNPHPQQNGHPDHHPYDHREDRSTFLCHDAYSISTRERHLPKRRQS